MTLLIVCLAAGAVAGQEQSFNGLCVGVTDGDSLTVLNGRTRVSVRLDGIDAPEPGQPFSNKAKQRLSELVYGREVLVVGKSTDKYGRLVARVVADGIDTSKLLVQEGLAWHFKKFSNELPLAQAEQAARAKRVGIWSDPTPVAPWDYRHPEGTESQPVRLFGSNSEAKAAAATSSFHGNVGSRVFHSSNCRNFRCQNCTAEFATADEAIGAGYRPAGCCLASLRTPAQSEPLAAAPSSGTVYQGNRKSHVFHSPGCRYYYCSNCTATFSSRDAAVAAGYRPGGCCRP